MFGCVKTDCVQHLNKLVVQQAERGWRFRLLWAEAVEVSVEGFLLEQAGLVGTQPRDSSSLPLVAPYCPCFAPALVLYGAFVPVQVPKLAKNGMGRAI